MSYSLFLDDERFPPRDDKFWVICRTMKEAQKTVEIMGWPIHISFDHDLGDDQPTGKDFANWVVEQDLEHSVLRSGFTFYVHSQNPVGAKNICSMLEQYLAHKHLG